MGYSSMSTKEDEKMKNRYNGNMDTHPLMEAISPHDPLAQYLQEQEEEITPQVRKLATKKRIKYYVGCGS